MLRRVPMKKQPKQVMRNQLGFLSVLPTLVWLSMVCLEAGKGLKRLFGSRNQALFVPCYHSFAVAAVIPADIEDARDENDSTNQIAKQAHATQKADMKENSLDLRMNRPPQRDHASSFQLPLPYSATFDAAAADESAPVYDKVMSSLRNVTLTSLHWELARRELGTFYVGDLMYILGQDQMQDVNRKLVLKQGQRQGHGHGHGQRRREREHRRAMETRERKAVKGLDEKIEATGSFESRDAREQSRLGMQLGRQQQGQHLRRRTHSAAQRSQLEVEEEKYSHMQSVAAVFPVEARANLIETTHTTQIAINVDEREIVAATTTLPAGTDSRAAAVGTSRDNLEEPRSLFSTNDAALPSTVSRSLTGSGSTSSSSSAGGGLLTAVAAVPADGDGREKKKGEREETPVLMSTMMHPHSQYYDDFYRHFSGASVYQFFSVADEKETIREPKPDIFRTLQHASHSMVTAHALSERARRKVEAPLAYNALKSQFIAQVCQFWAVSRASDQRGSLTTRQSVAQTCVRNRACADVTLSNNRELTTNRSSDDSNNNNNSSHSSMSISLLCGAAAERVWNGKILAENGPFHQFLLRKIQELVDMRENWDPYTLSYPLLVTVHNTEAGSVDVLARAARSAAELLGETAVVKEEAMEGARVRTTGEKAKNETAGVMDTSFKGYNEKMLRGRKLSSGVTHTASPSGSGTIVRSRGTDQTQESMEPEERKEEGEEDYGLLVKKTENGAAIARGVGENVVPVAKTTNHLRNDSETGRRLSELEETDPPDSILSGLLCQLGCIVGRKNAFGGEFDRFVELLAISVLRDGPDRSPRQQTAGVKNLFSYRDSSQNAALSETKKETDRHSKTTGIPGPRVQNERAVSGAILFVQHPLTRFLDLVVEDHLRQFVGSAVPVFTPIFEIFSKSSLLSGKSSRNLIGEGENREQKKRERDTNGELLNSRFDTPRDQTASIREMDAVREADRTTLRREEQIDVAAAGGRRTARRRTAALGKSKTKPKSKSFPAQRLSKGANEVSQRIQAEEQRKGVAVSERIVPSITAAQLQRRISELVRLFPPPPALLPSFPPPSSFLLIPDAENQQDRHLQEQHPSVAKSRKAEWSVQYLDQLVGFMSTNPEQKPHNPLSRSRFSTQGTIIEETNNLQLSKYFAQSGSVRKSMQISAVRHIESIEPACFSSSPPFFSCTPLSSQAEMMPSSAEPLDETKDALRSLMSKIDSLSYAGSPSALRRVNTARKSDRGVLEVPVSQLRASARLAFYQLAVRQPHVIRAFCHIYYIDFTSFDYDFPSVCAGLGSNLSWDETEIDTSKYATSALGGDSMDEEATNSSELSETNTEKEISAHHNSLNDLRDILCTDELAGTAGLEEKGEQSRRVPTHQRDAHSALLPEGEPCILCGSTIFTQSFSSLASSSLSSLSSPYLQLEERHMDPICVSCVVESGEFLLTKLVFAHSRAIHLVFHTQHATELSSLSAPQRNVLKEGCGIGMTEKWQNRTRCMESASILPRNSRKPKDGRFSSHSDNISIVSRMDGLCSIDLALLSNDSFRLNPSDSSVARKTPEQRSESTVGIAVKSERYYKQFQVRAIGSWDALEMLGLQSADIGVVFDRQIVRFLEKGPPITVAQLQREEESHFPHRIGARQEALERKAQKERAEMLRSQEEKTKQRLREQYHASALKLRAQQAGTLTTLQRTETGRQKNNRAVPQTTSDLLSPTRLIKPSKLKGETKERAPEIVRAASISISLSTSAPLPDENKKKRGTKKKTQQTKEEPQSVSQPKPLSDRPLSPEQEGKKQRQPEQPWLQDGTLIRFEKERHAYAVFDGMKHRVTEHRAMRRFGLNAPKLVVLRDKELFDAIPTGAPLSMSSPLPPKPIASTGQETHVGRRLQSQHMRISEATYHPTDRDIHNLTLIEGESSANVALITKVDEISPGSWGDNLSSLAKRLNSTGIEVDKEVKRVHNRKNRRKTSDTREQDVSSLSLVDASTKEIQKREENRKIVNQENGLTDRKLVDAPVDFEFATVLTTDDDSLYSATMLQGKESFDAASLAALHTSMRETLDAHLKAEEHTRQRMKWRQERRDRAAQQALLEAQEEHSKISDALPPSSVSSELDSLTVTSAAKHAPVSPANRRPHSIAASKKSSTVSAAEGGSDIAASIREKDIPAAAHQRRNGQLLRAKNGNVLYVMHNGKKRPIQGSVIEVATSHSTAVETSSRGWGWGGGRGKKEKPKHTRSAASSTLIADALAQQVLDKHGYDITRVVTVSSSAEWSSIPTGTRLSLTSNKGPKPDSASI